MSKINSFDDYSNQYNTNRDFSNLFTVGADNTAPSGGFSLTDYASIKNGSYKKVLKSYYAQQDAERLAQKGDSSQKLTLIKSAADSLKKSAETLNDASLWEKKKIKKKDEKTGEETEVEDYDWDAITKAVKSFVDDYNKLIEKAGNSGTKEILRNAKWLTGIVDSNSRLLEKIGITVTGEGNKMELDEEALKKSDITTLKSLFTGYGSLTDKISQKAVNTGNAAARTSGAAYTSSGKYSDTLSKLVSGMIDEKVGDDDDKDILSKLSSKKTDKEN